jgi:hypothetical protein
MERKTPSTFDLRVFAALLSPFCGLIATWVGRLLHVPGLGWWVAALVAPVSVVGLVKPGSILKLYQRWVAVTAPIGRALSILLLAGIYFLVITPMGWCLRLFGVDAAARRWEPASRSYWIDRPSRPDESLFNPF